MAGAAAPDESAFGLTHGSAADVLLGWLDTGYQRFLALTPREVAVNLGVSLAIALSLLVVARLVRWTAKRLRHKAAAATAEPETAPLTQRVLGFVLALLGAYAIARVWGLDPLGWIDAGIGSALIGGVLRAVVTLLFVLWLWELLSSLIEQSLARQARRAADLRRAAQLRSLAPLARGAARAAVFVIGALLVLSQVGLDIGPLLAGAGVVSIAIGFGAQTLVKDYLTGFSLILEDIAAVGDVIRIGDSAGVVETMTLRTIRLRDFDGTLHVFPYSEAQVVHNLTKAFSYYVLDLMISYGSDIDRALTVMREVGDELQRDPAFGPLMLGPIEIFGVDKLADSGVILKARLKTAPIKQWDVGREYNRRIKLAFDRAGVEIPFPHVKLVVGGEAAS